MTVPAADVAEELRRRLPGLPVKKLHKLLYYCQGHHLGAFGLPLFDERISAWDMGPVVGELWRAEKDGRGHAERGAAWSEAQLTTIGYVVSRYGRLTGRDLEILTHGEDPWREADAVREAGGSVPLDKHALERWFADAAREPDDEIDILSDEQLDHLLSAGRERTPRPSAYDDPERLRSRLS